MSGSPSPGVAGWRSPSHPLHESLPHPDDGERVPALVRIALPELLRAHVEPALPDDVDVAWYAAGAEAAGAARDAEVLYLHFWSREQCEAAVQAGGRLCWVATTAAGVDFLPISLLRERRILLTSGAGLHTIPVAEFALMCVLAAAKNLPALVRAHDRHEWLHAPGRAELRNSSALVIGYGSIGRAIGELLRGFGVDVTGVRRDPDDEPGIIGANEWRPLLARFDWVIIAAASTDETRNMIAASELAAMRRTAWLINIARGALIDEAELATALQRGEIAGAFLDATVREPAPPDDPLWLAPNAIVTAHSSGAATTRLPERSAALFLDNLGRYRGGEPLRNLVDLKLGY
jgi:phosphoglycerate dehydrogenase-like enzyme